MQQGIRKMSRLCPVEEEIVEMEKVNIRKYMDKQKHNNKKYMDKLKHNNNKNWYTYVGLGSGV